ncbi:subtilisin-like protease [Roridomyces roridus]|uniref:Subtilisin-like protease n=1 Tax=Roridomyces roridus TaxID=1738132 RepID=A0AAD7CGR1_9AGAR|nr:subtilisin-like protease [Roridomyces roridus]
MSCFQAGAHLKTMRPLILAFALIASGLSTSVKPAIQASQYVPNAYIIEFSSNNAGRVISHDQVYGAMRKKSMGFHVDHEYNTANILVGAAVKLDSSADATKISEIDGVVAVRPVRKFPAPKPVNSVVVKDPMDIGLDTSSTHKMTGVDKVHAQGMFGQGVKIGIIDTGVDYTHPLLGGGFGPGFKIFKGADLVGDAYDGGNTPNPGPNPLDQCNGHGTHVAGIIGASPNNTLDFSGVASSASLAAYRVFGCYGATTDAIISQALIMAYNDEMDIMTLSIGAASGWSEATASVVAERMVAQGRAVTVSAGNDGREGPWYTSEPAGGIGVISVGSVDNIDTPVQNATVHGVVHDPITYNQPLPLNVPGALPIYATSTNISQVDDACNPLPDSTPDLSGHLVVVHRGTCSFTQKLGNIQAKGGKVVFIYNSDKGTWAAIDVDGYTAVLISAADGKFLVQQFINKAPITVSFPQTGGAFNLPNPTGGLVSSFSTMGPTFEMELSPMVMAPGGGILSTFPLALGGYALLSGTSMACPFVAGAAALVMNELGTGSEVGAVVMRVLQTTAKSTPSSLDDPIPHTVAQQGAGLIQADLAVNMKSVVSPGHIALNDTAHFKANHTISIWNRKGDKPITYTISHVPAGTLETVSDYTVLSDPIMVPGAAFVQFSRSQVTVHPNDTKYIHLTFTPPPSADNASFPVYSGFIHVESPTETVKVTYLGVGASLKVAPLLDRSNWYFDFSLPAMIDSDGDVQTGPMNYTFMDQDASPFVVYRMIFGSAKVLFDLVKADIELPSSSRRVKTIGPLAEFDYVPRNNDDPYDGYSTVVLDGKYANGTRIDDGQYRGLLRALKIGGHTDKEEDWDFWLTPQFGVVTPEE